MVSVTPELSSSAVLMVGSQNGPMVWKGSTMPPGEAVAPACTLGHTAEKLGQMSEFSKLPRLGSACARAHHRAVKKAPKNITSEKMNQLMLQRNERSILRPYMPVSLSCTASRNHWNSTNSQKTMPKATAYAPHCTPLTHWPAPRITKKRPMAAMTGWREGPGTK